MRVVKTLRSLSFWVRLAPAVVGVSACLLLVPACTKSGGESSPAGSSSAQTGGPKIVLAQTEFDFGNVTEGDKLTHVFVVKNEGDATLVIDRVRTSCGCTVAALKTKEIAPGGSGEIEVVFDTKGRMGPNRKTITVASNDKQKANANIEIKANIERVLVFNPMNVRLNVEHGAEQKVEAWLMGKQADNAKLAIKSIEGGEGIKVELAEKKDGEKTVRGLVFAIKGEKITSGTGKVVVTTGVEAAPELEVRFTFNVVGNLELRPRALFFDDRSPAGKDRMMRVISKREDFKVKAVRIVEGPFKASFAKPETGPGFEVRVTLNGEAKADGQVAGKLEITTNDPLEPKVEVPLTLRPAPSVNRPPGLGMPPRKVPGVMPRPHPSN